MKNANIVLAISSRRSIRGFLVCSAALCCQLSCKASSGGSTPTGSQSDGDLSSASDSAQDGSNENSGTQDTHVSGDASDATSTDASGGSTATDSSESASGGDTTSGSDGEDSGEDTGEDGGDLLSKLDVSDVTVPAGVMAGARNWRVWGSESLVVAPVFLTPLADDNTLVCFTSGERDAPHAWVLRLSADDKLEDTFDLGAGFECRGLAAQEDGSFGALLWQPDADETKAKIFMNRYDAKGKADWSTELTNADNKPTDFGIGDSRVDYGDGRYGAYYHVHSDTGHEGDTLKWIGASDGKEETQWAWGCSHSMSASLRYHSDLKVFLSACVTDCYPGTEGSDFATTSIGGLYLEGRTKVLDMDAGCNGDMAGELGSATPASDGWKIVYNGHQAEATLGQSSYDPDKMNQDIGFSSVSSDKKPGPVVWLTDTAKVNEADPTIARYAADGQYVVGWTDPDAMAYYLLLVDGNGKASGDPVDISSKAQWGRRDDPMREAKNGDVLWAWFEDAGATVLHVARLHAGK